MNVGNAVGFFVMGLGMILLPSQAAKLFLSDSYSAVGLSGQWTYFMGWLNASLGAGFLLRHALAALYARIMLWQARSGTESIATQLLRPAVKLYGQIDSADPVQEQRAA